MNSKIWWGSHLQSRIPSLYFNESPTSLLMHDTLLWLYIIMNLLQASSMLVCCSKGIFVTLKAKKKYKTVSSAHFVSFKYNSDCLKNVRNLPWSQLNYFVESHLPSLPSHPLRVEASLLFLIFTVLTSYSPIWWMSSF